MKNKEEAKRDPLQGTKITSTIATGGGGGVFQSRVGALYLANMLTGLPMAFSLHGSRVEALRFEARYTGAHTDDIYCRVRSNDGTHLQLIQCKRGLNATVSNDDFVDGLQGAWRDFLGLKDSPFDRSCDVLVLATIAPATTANQASKRLCELSRASVDLADFLLKLETPKLLSHKHNDVWDAFKEVSKNTLADKYTEELVFQFLRRLRVDIHDLGTDSSQELSLVQALLTPGQPANSGELVWDGLFSYVFEQGIAVGTVTRATWASTAKAGLQEAVIFAVLDRYSADAAASAEVPEGWRMTLKRMDARGLKFGKPVGDGNIVPLEVANLEPELKQMSDRAEARMQLMNRLAAVRLWAGAITDRTSTVDPSRVESFKSPAEPYNEFFQLRTEFQGQEGAMLIGLEDELACALIQRWPNDPSEALEWAKAYLLEVVARQEEKDAWVHRGPMTGELRARTLILLASVDPQLSKMAEGLANIVTEPVWKVRRAAANAISDVLRPRQPMLADLLTTSLSRYAEALDTTNKRPRRRNRDIVDVARAATVKALLAALSEMKPCARAVPTSLAAVKEWTIALDAARSETPDTWRVQALTALVRLMADQEGNPRVQRHDPDYVDYEACWETGDLIAAELLAQPTDQSPPFELLDYCLEHAPDLSERVLESTLSACMKQEFANADAFWRVWGRAAAKILPDKSLRTRSRQTYSRFDKVLRTLLLCSMPWPKTWNDLPLLQSRPNYIANCLTAAGDSRAALENLLSLMAGVGRTRSVPGALSQLRDALGRAPADLFDDGNSLWDAETVCRVAVHEHRATLIQDVTLRRATLDILDRLIVAGSSLAFQLRDYLAASPTELA